MRLSSCFMTSPVLWVWAVDDVAELSSVVGVTFEQQQIEVVQIADDKSFTISNDHGILFISIVTQYPVP